jgi:glutamyl-tRNA synthetase
MQRVVRTRYAPSPTGSLHLGGLRTALFNALFARANGGEFHLRIEDTDRARLVPGAAEKLLSTLQRCNLHPAPGHFRQSDRLPVYHSHVDKLLADKSAYRCFCTPDRLDLVRRQQRLSGAPTRYDRACLHVSPDEAEDRAAAGEAHTVRLRVNRTGRTVLDDLVHGVTTFENESVDDQILLKSDGFPTYHLASVVDDHAMEISHVIRGEEWIASAPKHLMLYDAFGWTPPKFAHLPLLLNPDGTKLSKRQGDVAAEQFLDKGYLPSALNNFISLLGWHPSQGDNRELFYTFEELAQAFSLKDINRNGSVVDNKKLDWFNSKHIRHLTAFDEHEAGVKTGMKTGVETGVETGVKAGMDGLALAGHESALDPEHEYRVSQENINNKEALLLQITAVLKDALEESSESTREDGGADNADAARLADMRYVGAVAVLLSERVVLPADYAELAKHFFVRSLDYSDAALKQVQAKSCKNAQVARQRIEVCLAKLSSCGASEDGEEGGSAWDAPSIKAALDSAIEELGKTQKPVSVVLLVMEAVG